MNNEIESVKTFQQKISDKIKESIGDLITDEDLKPLIEKSIEQLLLDERIVPRGGSAYGHDTLPPLLHEIIEPLLKSQISKLVNIHLADHPEIFTDLIQTMIKDGFLKTMINHLEMKLQIPLMNFQREVHELLTKNNIG